MDLSPSLVTEQSSFHLWCRPRRRARAAPRCALRQVERSAQDLPLSTRSLPARAVPAAAGGEEPSLPQRLFPARWSWGGGAGRHAKFPPAARFQRVPRRCPRDDSRNDATCTKKRKLFVLQFVLSYPRGLCQRTRRQCLRGETMVWLSSLCEGTLEMAQQLSQSLPPPPF